MSKLPHNSLWARATTSSAPTRASSVLSKSQNRHRHPSSGQKKASASPYTSSTGSSGSALNYPSDSTLDVVGAVSAPFYGPQPAGVTEVFEQSAFQESASAFFVNNITVAPSIQSSFLLSAPMLKGVGSAFTLNPSSAARSIRSLHLWSHVPSVLDASLSAKKPHQGNERKLLFDANRDVQRVDTSDLSARNGADNSMSESIDALAKAGKENYMSWLAEPPSFINSSPYASTIVPSFTSRDFQDIGDVISHSASLSSFPSPPRTPSPSQSSFDQDLSRYILFDDVMEAPAKFAITTSAESGLPSTATSSSGYGASSTQIVPSSSTPSSSSSSSSAAVSTSSFSSSPPPLHQAEAGLARWSKAFNVPRSSKRHDFMFEHGAYGIPKRHPLSSIRSGGSVSSKGKSKDSSAQRERQSPGQDAVPTSKVQAAAEMLAAAADFLTGPQMQGSTSKEHRPMRGEEALNISFSGGSTAEGHEVHTYPAYGPRKISENGLPGASAQQRQQQNKPNKMTIRGEDGRIIKDRLRSVQVGEDSYFLRPDSLGVADGVGGWSSRPGADPALFSRLLMHFCAVELSRYDNVNATSLAADNGRLLQAWAAVDPVEVMHRAWERCVRAARREGILGSSTALLALLRGDELRIANVGDCVLMIIRNGEMLFRSTEQQHSFNFPVQLGMMGDTHETLKTRTEAANKARAAGEGEVKSDQLEDYDDVEDMPATSKEAMASGSSFEELIDGANMHGQSSKEEDDSGPEWDEPRRDAGRWSVRVEEGDIIVVGSDGLMDNLFDEDIIEEVLRFIPVNSDGAPQGAEQESFKVDSSTFSPQSVSEALCSRAKAISEDSRAISSPFQQRAMEEGLHYVGGKHDDISVLVCLVGEREGIDTSGEVNVTTTTATSGSKCFIH
ncbi:hypothetical protein CBS101457_006326 [Exobasidium rhododendri]|nr:hypothetical protein CBS101457_006326 [Exobasidium rhododendri]